MALAIHAFAAFGGINPSTLNFSFSSTGVAFADPNGGRIDQAKWVFFNSNGGESQQGTLYDAGNNYTSFQQVGAGGGSLGVRIYSLPNESYNPNRTGSVAMVLLSNGVGFATYNLNFPNVTIPAGTYREFYIGSYTSEGFQQFNFFHLFTGTALGSRVSEYLYHTYSDTVTMVDSKPIGRTLTEFDSFPLREFFQTNPRIYPVEKIPVIETIDYITQRHGTITDWNFMPDYRLLFQGTEAIGTYGTTIWHQNVSSFGRISKSIKHWSGDFEIGEWNPELADPNNDLYGSLFATQGDMRGKEVKLMAMIADKPLTYIPQFTGFLDDTEWKDGKTNWLIRDKIRDLPYRSFVWDYENLGTIKNDGRQIGIVKRIVGTDVMFDDDGDINYIKVKTDGNSYISVGDIALGAAVGAKAGGWIGAGVGAIGGFIKGLFGGSDPIETGYWRLTDFNVIPDGLIKSGAKMKFYGGSISGIATNTNNPLFGVKEYVVAGGTFRNTQFGFNGTANFDDTNGINVGDYIYVRRPMVLAGNPAEIIKSILCGSNIDIPYYAGTSVTSSGFFGSSSPSLPNDFGSSYDSELNPMGLFQLSKVINPDFDTSPFDEVKELVRECQISFYIDESNKFSVRSIKPRNLISSGTEAHYREGVNILSGFSWKRSNQDALVGVRIYYNWIGEGNGAFLNQYNSFLEIESNNPLPSAKQWGTIESKWLHLDDDARIVAYRTLVNQEHGIDRIQLPTTLYGITHNITDVIRVTHRTGSLGTTLFELESYEKSFDDSKVDLTAIALNRSWNYGNCLWIGTSINISVGTQSGWSIMGFSGFGTRYATNVGTIDSFDEILDINNFSLSDSSLLSLILNHYIAFGTNSNSFTEICHLIGFDGNSDVFGFRVKRGLFNTIPRTYFPNEYIYDLGAVQIDSNGNYIPFGASARGTYVFGTSTNIGSNIGTAFRFF